MALEIVARGAWLIKLRWLAGIAVLLGTCGVWLVVGSRAPIVPMFAVGLAILFYNWLFFQLYKHRPQHQMRLASAQFLTDWGALTILVHYTGGVASPLLFFYVFHVIIASILFSPRIAAIHAAIGVMLVGTVTLCEISGLLPHLPVPGFESVDLLSAPEAGQRYFFFGLTVLVVYLLSSSMAKRLWARTRQVIEQRNQTQAALYRTRSLNEIAIAATSSLELNLVMETITKSVVQTMSIKASSIRLLDDSGDTLAINASYGLSEAYLAKGAVQVVDSPVDAMALQGSPIRIPDVAKSELLQYPAQMLEEGIQSLVVVPLVLRDKTIGVLRAYCSKKTHFSDDDVDFLSALAGQGAIAIENARSYTDLQALEVAKSKFVYVVAHELKSPVAGATSSLSLLSEGYAGELSDQQLQLVNRAQRRIASLSALLQDLLALGAMQEKLVHAKIEPLSISQALKAVTERVQPTIETKGLELTMDLASEPLTVLGQKDDFERMVGNLFENAVKYTPTKGAVKVLVRHDGDMIEMEFTDTGIGIAPEALPKLFEEFYRAPNARQSIEGTGLGLALVKRIVDSMKGTISVQSEVNKGTTFTVRLPKAP